MFWLERLDRFSLVLSSQSFVSLFHIILLCGSLDPTTAATIHKTLSRNDKTRCVSSGTYVHVLTGCAPYATHRLPLGTGPRPRKLCAAFSFSATNKLIRRLASASCASRANPRRRKQKVRKSVKKLLQGGANLASRKRWVSHTPARCVRQPCLTKNQAGLLSARTGTS